MALGAIREDEERMRGFKTMRESGSKEEKEEREVLVERKKRRVMENMKR